MKYFLVILVFLFLNLVSYSQIKQYSNTYRALFPNNSSGYNWQLIGNVCQGCGAGYIGIERSQFTNSFGNYQYIVYLYTSSFNNNNQLSYTYFNKVKVYALFNNQWIALDNNLPFDMIVGSQPTIAYTLFSPSSLQYILVTIETITPY